MVVSIVRGGERLALLLRSWVIALGSVNFKNPNYKNIYLSSNDQRLWTAFDAFYSNKLKDFIS